MRLVKLGDHWVNPDAVFYVWECERVAGVPSTLIAARTADSDTQPEAPPAQPWPASMPPGVNIGTVLAG